MAEYLKCNHGVTAYDDYGQAVCPICGCRETATPDLTGRIARCIDCGRENQSNIELPFFEHKPGEKYDRYYCGCRGWD